MMPVTMRSPSRRVGRYFFAGLIAVASTLAVSPVAQTEEPPVFALINARVVPVSGPPLDKGIVVVRRGIIESVGANVQVPQDARVIDVAGLTVYPGLIDALSDVGVEETQPPPTTAATTAVPFRFPGQQQPQAPAGTPDERQGLTPYLRAADILNTTSRKMESARTAGITTALVAPRKGLFQGQSVLVNLSSTSIGQMVVKTPVAMHIGLQGSGGFGGSYPGSLMGVLAFSKQTLLDAQNYELAWSIYNANPGAARPEYSKALETLQPVLKRQIPVVLPGTTPPEIQRSIDLATEFGLHMLLSGGGEAVKIAPVLKERKIPVLLSLKFPERDRDADPAEEEELGVLRRRVEAPATAAGLARAGVQFAFQSGDMANPKDFIRNAAKTVEAGLDKQIALRSLTLTAAEIFGVADRLGSIEKGKTANLVVTTGDILDTRTRVKYVFVDGRKFDISEPETPRQGEPPITRATDLSGTWTFRVNSHQGPVDATFQLKQMGRRLSGTGSTPLGTVEITDGTVNGNQITFKISLNTPDAGNYLVTFTGAIDGDRITGTADVGQLGKMEFTGSRNPS